MEFYLDGTDPMAIIYQRILRLIALALWWYSVSYVLMMDGCGPTLDPTTLKWTDRSTYVMAKTGSVRSPGSAFSFGVSYPCWANDLFWPLDRAVIALQRAYFREPRSDVDRDRSDGRAN